MKTNEKKEQVEELLKKLLELKEPNENAVIWRYVDFVKFMSLIQKRKLFFPKGVNLPDPFEGATTEANISSRLENLQNVPPDLRKFTLEQMKLIRKYIYVNSWNINKEESNLLWGTYIKQNYGVVIKSKFKNLKKCFQNGSYIKIRFGKIKYISYKIDKFNELAGYLYFLRKREIYKYESELRILTLIWPHQMHQISKEDFTNDGIYVPVNLDILIDKIVVSPGSKSWYMNLVESILKDHGLKKKVEQSSLDKTPKY